MRAAAPVTATLARLVGATTEEDRFKILVDLYDRGFEDGAGYAEDRALTRCPACRLVVDTVLAHFLRMPTTSPTTRAWE